jgi:hypothetical protein
MKSFRWLLVVGVAVLLLTAGAQTPERVDLAAIEKIKAAEKTSQAMDIASLIAKTYGARLTNSTNAKSAGQYVQKKLVEWKLTDVQTQTFNFGNGWKNDRFSLQAASDPTLTLQAYSKPWTIGTNGPVTAEVVEGVRSQADLTALKGKLRGKFVLVLPAPASLPPTTTPGIKRFTDAELVALAAPGPGAAPAAAAAPTAAQPVARGATPPPDAPEAPSEEAGFFAWVENALSAAPAPATNAARTPSTQMPSRSVVTKFYFDEGVAGMIEPAMAINGALFAVPDTGETVPWRKGPTLTKSPPQIVVAVQDYAKLVEKVQKAGPVTLQADIQNTYQTTDTLGFNIVGDIKGTDKAAELVVLGAHLDSWQLGMGATDNAAGVGVVMDAVRILKNLGLPMRRTVRIGLWTGEEQGLLGSMAFVDKYFFQRPIRQIKAGHEKLSVYFNVDNGTGAIRGINMQGHTATKPIFQAWMAPFKSMGMTTLADRSVSGSDHMSFENIGLPGFQFLQDPIEYNTRTHHSTDDTVERLIKEDLSRNAVIVASWVYLAANRNELLPRKPLPRNVYPAGSPVP